MKKKIVVAALATLLVVLVLVALLVLPVAMKRPDHPLRYDPMQYGGDGKVLKDAQGKWRIELPVKFYNFSGGSSQTLRFDDHPAMPMKVLFETTPLQPDERSHPIPPSQTAADAQLELWYCKIVFTNPESPNQLMVIEDTVANLLAKKDGIEGFHLGRHLSIWVKVAFEFRGPLDNMKPRDWTPMIILKERGE